MNNHLVLICGKSATGKSWSLKDLEKPEGVLYLNCENNKNLPFDAKFFKDQTGTPGFTITDPLQVYKAFTFAETNPEIHTIIIDTSTYLMDLFESLYVIGADNTRVQWGAYAQFWKNLMAQYVAKSTKNVIILAHTADIITGEGINVINETFVPVKGSLKNQGIESYFSTIISTKKIPITQLKDKNSLLTITQREKNLGYKHVFQTMLTKDTVNERMRNSYGLWVEKDFEDPDSPDETYIDNNIQFVIDRLHKYYT